jgi:hypothetical protein
MFFNSVFKELNLAGIYYKTEEEIPIMINLLYRNIKSSNRFVTAYLGIGGPASNNEIEKLPLSFFSFFNDRDTVILPFCNTLIANLGFGIGLPIRDKDIFATGIKDRCILQFALKDDSLGNIDSIQCAQKSLID